MNSTQLLLRIIIMEDLRRLNELNSIRGLSGKINIEYDLPNKSITEWDEVIESLPKKNEWIERIGAEIILFKSYSSKYCVTVKLLTI